MLKNHNLFSSTVQSQTTYDADFYYTSSWSKATWCQQTSPPSEDFVSVFHFMPWHYIVIGVFNTVTMSRYYCSPVRWLTFAKHLWAYVRNRRLFLWNFSVGYILNLFYMNHMSNCGDLAVELCSFCWNHGYCLFCHQ